MKESSDVSTFTVVNPATEVSIAEVELADLAATDRAIAREDIDEDLVDPAVGSGPAVAQPGGDVR